MAANPSELRELLTDCAEKLHLYRKVCGAEYVGGIEYTALAKRIDAAIAALTAHARPVDGGVVQVCPRCDIAGCKHLRSKPAQATPAAVDALVLIEAVEWARAEFEDKRHVAECRGDTGLAIYYAGCRDRMDEALAAPHAQDTAPRGGGEAFVLVPREPTAAMIEAFIEGGRDWFLAYAAMIAAAPPAAQASGIEAPTGHPPHKWTPQEKRDVRAAMDRIHDREAAQASDTGRGEQFYRRDVHFLCAYTIPHPIREFIISALVDRDWLTDEDSKRCELTPLGQAVLDRALTHKTMQASEGADSVRNVAGVLKAVALFADGLEGVSHDGRPILDVIADLIAEGEAP